MLKKLKNWLSNIKWRSILLSESFIFGYPFVVFATIALASGSLLVSLAWGIWLCVIILSLPYGK